VVAVSFRVKGRWDSYSVFLGGGVSRFSEI
jgi:hypothetical protein